jgi:hypothetical protein
MLSVIVPGIAPATPIILLKNKIQIKALLKLPYTCCGLPAEVETTEVLTALRIHVSIMSFAECYGCISFNCCFSERRNRVIYYISEVLQ